MLLLPGLLAVLVGCNRPGHGGSASGGASSEPPVQMLKRTFPASKETNVAPLAVGQWTRFRVQRPDGTSFLTDKVVKKEGDAFWIESVLERPERKIVTQVLLAMKGNGSRDAVEVRELRVKMPDGKLQDYRGRQLRSAQLMYERVLESIEVPKLSGLPTEKVRVPAGTFDGCYRRHVSPRFKNIRGDRTVWTHPAVPISGTVKSVTDGNEITVELVDFGMTGAMSTL